MCAYKELSQLTETVCTKSQTRETEMPVFDDIVYLVLHRPDKKIRWVSDMSVEMSLPTRGETWTQKCVNNTLETRRLKGTCMTSQSRDLCIVRVTLVSVASSWQCHTMLTSCSLGLRIPYYVSVMNMIGHKDATRTLRRLDLDVLHAVCRENQSQIHERPYNNGQDRFTVASF